MKRYISLVLVLCLLVSSVCPEISLMGEIFNLTEHPETYETDVFYLEEVVAEPDDTEDDRGEVTTEPGDIEENDEIIPEPIHKEKNGNDEAAPEHGCAEEFIEYADVENRDIPFVYITVDNERNITVVTSPGAITVEIVGENGTGDVTITLTIDDPNIKIVEDNISVALDIGWTYEIDIDSYTIIISPPPNHAALFDIDIDIDGNISISPYMTHGVVLDGDFILIEFPFELYDEDIKLTLPDDWVYKISYMFSDSIEIDEWEWSEPELCTIITLTHTWNSIGQASSYGFMPLVSNAPFNVFNLPINATLAQWNTAIGTTGNRVVSVQGNQTNIPAVITISGNRQIIIASNGTDIENHVLNNTPFVIGNISGTGRHFTVGNGSTLTLSNIVLNGNSPTGTVARGGVEVSSGGHLIMENGSAITNNHWGNGTTGAVRVNGGTFTMNSGLISGNTTNANATNRGGAGVFVTGAAGLFILNNGIITNNHVLQTAEAGMSQGGGGVAIDMGATFRMYNGEITWNTVTAFRTMAGAAVYHGGGGVLVGRDGTAVTATSSFFMYGGIIASNTATHMATALDIGAGEGGGVFVSPRGNFRMYGGSIIDNLALSNGRGGGGVFVLGGRFATANPTDIGGNVIEVTEKIIADNSARGGGGGIMIMRTDPTLAITGAISGEVTIAEGTIIRDNMAGLVENITNAAGLGGGILVRWGGSLIIEGGYIYDNTALRPGGGVATLGQNSPQATVSVTMSGGKIYDNHARGDIATALGVDRGNGGGVLVGAASTWNMTGGEIADNLADNSGGGVFVSSASSYFNMSGGVIEGNISAGTGNAGGGVYGDALSIITVSDNAEIIGNEAAMGGGVAIAGNFTMYGGSIRKNHAQTAGGGVHVAQGSHFNGIAGVIANNIADDGGGMFVPHENLSNIEISTAFAFTGNSARNGLGIDNDLADTHRTRINPGTVSVSFASIEPHAFTNFDINAIGSPVTSLTVSKTVAGAMGNRNMAFEFIVFFKNADGSPLSEGTQFDYVGDTIANSGAIAPQGGTLTLDSKGSVVFELMHGQIIIINDVPLDIYAQIIETPDALYYVSFIDSENGEDIIENNDTFLLQMSEERAFHFTNTRDIPPPMGINMGNAGAIFMLFGLVFAFALTMFLMKIAYRRDKNF